MSRLHRALAHALGQDLGQDQGAVFIDGRKAYNHWVEPEDTVTLQVPVIGDVAFLNQEVQFDHRGVAQVSDTDGQRREIRILVMVPFGPVLEIVELVNPPGRDGLGN